MQSTDNTGVVGASHPYTVGGDNPGTDYEDQGSQHDTTGYSRGLGNRYSDYRVTGPDSRNYSVSDANSDYSNLMAQYGFQANGRQGFQGRPDDNSAQNAYIRQLQMQASGQAPSASAAFAQQQALAGQQQAQALGNSAVGGANSVLAQRNVGNQSAALQGQGNMLAAQGRIQDQQQAQNALSTALNQQQQQNVQQAQMGGQNYLQNMQGNQGLAQFYAQQQLGTMSADEQSRQNYENARYLQQEINRTTASANAHGQSNNSASTVAGIGSTILSML